jgi:hypothetical protein
MPLAGFEPTIPVIKRVKIFHALDRAATVTGRCRLLARSIRVRISGTLNGYNFHYIIIRCYGYFYKVLTDILQKLICIITG